jgi:protein-tyrosine-phosphatase
MLDITARLTQIKANILKNAVQKQDVVDFYLLSLLPPEYLNKSAIGPEHINGLALYQSVIESLRDEYVRRGMAELKDEAETTRWTRAIPDEDMPDEIKPYYKYHESGYTGHVYDDDDEEDGYSYSCEGCGMGLSEDDALSYGDYSYCESCINDKIESDIRENVFYCLDDNKFIVAEGIDKSELESYVPGNKLYDMAGHEEHRFVSLKEGTPIYKEVQENLKKQLQLRFPRQRKPKEQQPQRQQKLPLTPRQSSLKKQADTPWWEAPTDFDEYTSSDYYKIFEYAPWKEMYGGPAWAEIAKTINQMEHETNWQKLVVLIDHFHNLGHNTGRLLDKFPEWLKWFENLLDLKASKDAVRHLIPMASPKVRSLVQEYYAVQRGGEDWRTPQYPTTDFSKSDINMILRDPDVPAETLLNAAKYVLEHTLGYDAIHLAQHPNMDVNSLLQLRNFANSQKDSLPYGFIDEFNKVLREKGLLQEEPKALSFEVGDRVTYGNDPTVVTITEMSGAGAKVLAPNGETYAVDVDHLKKASSKNIQLRKLSKKDIVAYEGGYPTEDDSVQFGMAPPGWMANEPWKKTKEEDPTRAELIEYYVYNSHPEHGKIIDFSLKDRYLKFEDGFKISIDELSTILPKESKIKSIPKPDRSSDEVNDYQQNYEWGPQDLGRVHQHQPGDSFWLPAGTEDDPGVSSNVMMSSLNNKADFGMGKGWWISPKGEVFDLEDESEHQDWIQAYGPDFEGKDPIDLGWTRIRSSITSNELDISVKSLRTIPDFLNDFIVKHPTRNIILQDNISDVIIAYEDAVISGIQKTVNKVLKQPIMSSFSTFMHKQSSLYRVAITKQYALYIDGRLAIRTLTRAKAEKILKERFPEAYTKGNYEIREEEFKRASLKRKAGKQEINLGNMPYTRFTVLINPSRSEIIGLFNRAKTHEVRWVLDSEGTLYLWDAYVGEHLHVIDELEEMGYPVNYDDVDSTPHFGIADNAEKLFVDLKEWGQKVYANLKQAHCGPCSSLKFESLHILSDLRYKDNLQVSEEDLCELSKLSSLEDLQPFLTHLSLTINKIDPKKYEQEVQKLKNFDTALWDIKNEITEGVIKYDKPLSKKEAVLGKKAFVRKSDLADFYLLTLLPKEYYEFYPEVKALAETVIFSLKDQYLKQGKEVLSHEVFHIDKWHSDTEDEPIKSEPYTKETLPQQLWPYYKPVRLKDGRTDLVFKGETNKYSFKDFYILFKYGNFSDQYGGKTWAEVSEGFDALERASSLNQIIVAIDHINDLSHNNATIMTKLFSGYRGWGVQDWIEEFLDVKATTHAFEFLIPLASSDVRKIVTEYLSVEKGKRVPSLAASLNKQAFDSVKNVLILCTGNTCRSPMAENILRSIRPDLNVTSRGIYATPGLEMTPAVGEALKEVGVAYQSHSSKQVVREDVQNSDLILVMEEWQKNELENMFPEAKGKTYMLGASDIGDPVGLTLEDYKRIRDEITQGLSIFASLDKQANPPSRMWIAPDGREFAFTSIHPVWMRSEEGEKVLRSYGLNIKEEIFKLTHNMFKQGWTRISNEPAGTGFQIEVDNMFNPPSYLDDFIAKYFTKGDKILIGSYAGTRGVEITDPFPSIQKAVSKEFMRVKQASLDIPENTQNEIAKQYGPEMLVGLRFYSEALEYGHDSERALAYALDQLKKMGKEISREEFLKVFEQYKT